MIRVALALALLASPAAAQIREYPPYGYQPTSPAGMVQWSQQLEAKADYVEAQAARGSSWDRQYARNLAQSMRAEAAEWRYRANAHKVGR